MVNPKLVAIDSCFAIIMSKFLDTSIEDGGIRRALDENRFSSSYCDDLLKIKNIELLKDKYLGHYEKTENGKKFYNLIHSQTFKTLINSGEIQLVITPCVLNELDPLKNAVIIPFIKKYCKIVSFHGNEAVKFFGKVNCLAEKYVDLNAMDNVYCAKFGDYIPENDAYIMAETTILGLHLITINEKDFIKSKKSTTKDRLTKICDINECYGYTFYDENKNFKVIPRPYTPSTFLAFYQKYGMNFCDPPLNNTDSKCVLKDFQM